MTPFTPTLQHAVVKAQRDPYQDLNVFYGDLHNHCGISYGHGSLEEALRNAKEQLDFCSVTGHALWPDMPEPDPEVQYIIDFHLEGFAKLRRLWPQVQKTMEHFHQDGEFVTFLSFEMHSSADGDRAVIYNGASGDILEVEDLTELEQKIRQLRSSGVGVIALPHHIGYLRGQRGINWDTYDAEISPIVEIVSMHGCSEGSENTRPFLHVMGASDYASTMAYGLARKHLFGVVGSTDHHSAHPGSYGHGRTAVWATGRTRHAIWDAICQRRTYALTGDRIALQFTLNGQMMGSDLGFTLQRDIELFVSGGAAIDCIDIIKNGRLLRRFSEDEQRPTPMSITSSVHTKLYLEVGWGERKVRTDWDIDFGISEGEILAVEPRFRGSEVVAPPEADASLSREHYLSHWQAGGLNRVQLTTATFGNPNNSTNASQGICLEVIMPRQAEVRSTINGRQINIPLPRLLVGAKADRLGKIGTAGFRFNRAPEAWEFNWHCQFTDTVTQSEPGGDTYYIRVRQKNDQWAWSSPILVLDKSD